MGEAEEINTTVEETESNETSEATAEEQNNEDADEAVDELTEGAIVAAEGDNHEAKSEPPAEEAKDNTSTELIVEDGEVKFLSKSGATSLAASASAMIACSYIIY